MKSHFHGVFSLLIICIAVIIALFSLFDQSGVIIAGYILILIFAPVLIVYSYCSKCVCRDYQCGHVFPGKLTKLLPERRQGPYSFIDITSTAVSLAALIGYPQFWLWQNRPLFIVFWMLTIFGLTEIILFVCKGCKNENCPVCTIRNA
jgi:hypothetical protein